MPADPLDLDWSAVSHAYGPATDLPDLLRALRSPEEERRAEAADQFRARVLHQGSLYPAGAATVSYLIGLLADDEAPDRTLGHELYGWPFHDEDLALAASVALGDLPVRAVPGLAAMLLDGLAAGGEDMSRFYYATRLLLSLVFPDGPLPDGASPADLTAQQYAAAHAVLRSGLVEHVATARLLEECNLPGDEETLRSWCPTPPPNFVPYRP